jgi:hypothetical protein
MRDLVINGNAIDIAGYARQQDSGTYRANFTFMVPCIIIDNIE